MKREYEERGGGGQKGGKEGRGRTSSIKENMKTTQLQIYKCIIVTNFSSSVDPMSLCPCRWCMAFLAPCGLSRWAMAVPGLFTRIFTYGNVRVGRI